MRLSCPSCQTEYDVPDAALMGRTRKLRCATCGTQFEAGPIVVTQDEPAPTPAEIEYMQRPRAAAPTGVSYSGASAPDRLPEYRQPDVTQEFAPSMPVSRPVDLPQRPDPAEVRHQADRESFAALLEASRQPGSQNADAGAKISSSPVRKAANPWIISVLILLLVVVLIFLERDHIMAAWPPSIRFFAALGLK